MFGGRSGNFVGGAASLSTGLVAYWKLDGNAIDNTGNGHNGTVYGNLTYGSNTEFDGSSSYINAGNSSDLNFGTGDFTVCSWFNSAETNWQNREDMAGKGDPSISGYELSDTSAGPMLFIGDYGELHGQPVSSNAWHLACGLRNNSNIYLYVDGVSVASGSNTENLDSSISFVMGKHPTKTEVFFKGQIGRVGVWNRAISNSEIQTLYNSGNGATYPFRPGASGTVTGNATFLGDLSENLISGVSGIVNGIKTRLYNALNPQINFVRNFVTDGPWSIIADSTFVNLSNNIVDLFNASSTTHTTLQAINGGFILAPLAPGNITSCGVLSQPGIYNLAVDINNYKYGNCFVITSDGVTLNGNGHTVDAYTSTSSPTSTAVAIYAEASSTVSSRYDAYTNLTIKNIRFTDFAHGLLGMGADNVGGTAGNGASTTISRSILADVNVSGGDPTEKAGNGGNVTFLSSTSTGAIISLGGDSTACGTAGNGGSIVASVDSHFAAASSSAGKVTGCSGNNTGTQGTGGSFYGGAAPSSDPDPFPYVPPVVPPTTPVVTGGGSSWAAPTHTATSTYTSPFDQPIVLPINLPQKLVLQPLPVFGGTSTKNSFDLIQPISSFLSEPLPTSVTSFFKKSPAFKTFLQSIGVTYSQDLAALASKPVVVTSKIKLPTGFFTISSNNKAISTTLTSAPSHPIAQLFHIASNTKLNITLRPITTNDTSVVFNGRTYTLDNANSLTITAPSKTGKYFLTSPSTPVSLEIDVLSVSNFAKEVASEGGVTTPSTNPVTNIFQKVVNWIGGWWQ